MAARCWRARWLNPVLIGADDIWHEVRLSVENNRPRAARAAAALLGPATEKAVAEALDNPARYLARQLPAAAQPMALLALMRLAATDPEATANLLQGGWAQRLAPAFAATAWAHAARHAAFKQLTSAAVYARQSWQARDIGARTATSVLQWSDELLAWHVRAALRQPGSDRQRWPLVQRAVAAMSPTEQREPAWIYWRARADLATAEPGAHGEAVRVAARAALQEIARQTHFYGHLAAEELGLPASLPAAPAPLTAAELAAPRQKPGFARALQLIALGLRNEGVREWNFMLRGLADRELLASAQLACDHAVWDRCINTSERARGQFDLAQRFPVPLREQVLAQARATGLDAALVLGLIRQESRFIGDTRSSAGASGLMQLMPGTARWMARKLGLEYRPSMIADPAFNLQLGAAYLKRLVDDFEGSLPMATAAYNAGPGRPRRWREGGRAGAGGLGREHPLQRNPRLREEGADQQRLLLGRAQRPGPAFAEGAAGAAHRPRDPAAGTQRGELP
jgi:soluble lytic murein transglycosylase